MRRALKTEVPITRPGCSRLICSMTRRSDKGDGTPDACCPCGTGRSVQPVNAAVERRGHLSGAGGRTPRPCAGVYVVPTRQIAVRAKGARELHRDKVEGVVGRGVLSHLGVAAGQSENRVSQAFGRARLNPRAASRCQRRGSRAVVSRSVDEIEKTMFCLQNSTHLMTHDNDSSSKSFGHKKKLHQRSWHTE